MERALADREPFADPAVRQFLEREVQCLAVQDRGPQVGQLREFEFQPVEFARLVQDPAQAGRPAQIEIPLERVQHSVQAALTRFWRWQRGARKAAASG